MSSFLTHVQDRLKVCGPLSYKNMFGGFGVYSGSQIFAMVIKDRLYFRVGQSNQAEYESAGMAPFTYAGKDGKLVRVSYWEVPEEILEDDQDLIFWFRKSLAEANKASSLKKKSAPKKKVIKSKVSSSKKTVAKKKAARKKSAKRTVKKTATKRKVAAKKKKVRSR
ncbi:TfoX/Sxy family protein [Leptospira licerasiae]|uniref:TfoX N-terminal domain protein n=1 Tax=Leptospira licerasiae str. MMD4847 TaxID=1049971 RepID=A0ABN0H4U9_9LEPT|nr:TfoX/Sxy family protein [Leptospira licerasiae]EIE00748.1 TfoX N-terminal domain protein [Leptospira licerasiae serovar Varillal str. VAR 010]EJZ40612.1 TfoX N-terminal domain protein [Leptospira licerasiae str. MMD4847]TGM88649.1 TfoX family protein [Leptospira licerasiae]